MNTNEVTSSVEQVSTTPDQFGHEWRVIVLDTVRTYVRGTREQAEAEAASIVRGIVKDREWMANR